MICFPNWHTVQYEGLNLKIAVTQGGYSAIFCLNSIEYLAFKQQLSALQMNQNALFVQFVDPSVMVSGNSKSKNWCERM